MTLSKQRHVRCERLEQRQLLAGDVCFASVADEAAVAETIQLRTNPEAEQGPFMFVDRFQRLVPDDALFRADHVDRVVPDSFSVLPNTDLLVEDGGFVAVYRSNFAAARDDLTSDARRGTVYLMQRGENGDLVGKAAIQVEFTPRDLLLTDESLIIIGQTGLAGRVRPVYFLPDGADADVVWTAVNLNDPSDRHTGSIEGLLSGVVQTDTRLYISALQKPDAMPDVYPPPPPAHSVVVLDVEGDQVERVGYGKIGTAITEGAIVGDEIVVTEQSSGSESYPIDQIETEAASDSLQPNIAGQLDYRIVRYRVDDGTLVEAGALALGSGYRLSTRVAVDGKTAVVVARDAVISTASVRSLNRSTIRVSLIDLTETVPRLFQSVDVPVGTLYNVFEIGTKAVVIGDGPNRLLIVDTNQDIDVDPSSRISRIDYGTYSRAGVLSPVSVDAVSPTQFIVSRPAAPVLDADDTNGVAPTAVQLSLFSLETLSFESTLETQSSNLAVWASGAEQPTIVALHSGYAWSPLMPKLQLVRVSDDGVLTAGGTVSLEGSLELDANAERLLVRKRDRLVEYRWDALDNPTETVLGDALPAPVAVDDLFQRNADGRNVYLNVLENDQFVNLSAAEVVPIVDLVADELPRIVELIDAPEGVLVISGTTVRIDQDLLRSGESFQFQYTLRQFGLESTANVTVELRRYSNGDIEAVVDQIVATLAETLEIPATDITVGRRLDFTSRPMPATIDNLIRNPLGGAYGVVVDLQADGNVYRYAADFNGNVAELTQRQLKTVMALRLAAVDANGTSIDTLQTGDEFFLEVTAEDLRSFGAGVFGVAFDLPLPPAQLELTGAVELLGLFDQLGSVDSESGIDDFSAIENLIDHPGDSVLAVVRFGVRAIAGGEVKLELSPADKLGAELLLRGRDTEVSPLEVRFGSLELSIDGVRPTDIDANGRVTPLDALRVINFLGRHGVFEVDRLAETLSGEPENVSLDLEGRLTAMRRFDINADRWITPQDALLVINEVAREAARPTVLVEGELSDDDSQDDEALLRSGAGLF